MRVPSDLDKLWKDYVAEQQEAGLKVEKNKGFSGKGYKFNEEEAMMHDERKQLQKFQLGMLCSIISVYVHYVELHNQSKLQIWLLKFQKFPFQDCKTQMKKI